MALLSPLGMKKDGLGWAEGNKKFQLLPVKLPVDRKPGGYLFPYAAITGKRVGAFYQRN